VLIDRRFRRRLDAEIRAQIAGLGKTFAEHFTLQPERKR
jgi:hypothetical protein